MVSLEAFIKIRSLFINETAPAVAFVTVYSLNKIIFYFRKPDIFVILQLVGYQPEIAHAHDVPVIVDAAAELPPKDHLWALSNQGADLVVFSGSKDLRGPQTSGLMVGRADLIAAALSQSAPHERVIGRPMKAGKEVVAGLVAAVELYLTEDEAARFAEWDRIAAYLVKEMGKNIGLKLRQFHPAEPYIQPACIPRVGITFQTGMDHTPSDLKTALWMGDPPIAVEVFSEEIWLNVHTLTMAEAEIIVHRFETIMGN